MAKFSEPKINLTSGLLLLVLGILWGGSFFFAEIALSEVPPLTVALHRVFWAMPVLFIVVMWKGIGIPKSMRAWLCYFVMGALNNAIPFSLIFWGQTHIGSGLASILYSTTAFFGVIVAGIFLVDERLTVWKIIGALFGVFGVATIMGLDALTNFDLSRLAQLAILGAALSFALAGVWGKWFLSEYPSVMNALGMLVASTVIMFPIAVITEGIPILALSTEVWASLMAIAILSTAIASLLYFKILVLAGAANLMLVALLIPPIGVGLSVAFLDEKMGVGAGLGFGLIAMGLLITDGRLMGRLRRKPN